FFIAAAISATFTSMFSSLKIILNQSSSVQQSHIAELSPSNRNNHDDGFVSIPTDINEDDCTDEDTIPQFFLLPPCNKPDFKCSNDNDANMSDDIHKLNSDIREMKQQAWESWQEVCQLRRLYLEIKQHGGNPQYDEYLSNKYKNVD
ncbi:unnamed protein product, partial [Meganyctiphanes norvegica]